VIDLAGVQEIGARDKQQDVWAGFLTREGAVALLADGMGGMAEGDWAAQTVVNAAQEQLKGIRLTQRALVDTLEYCAEQLTELSAQRGFEGRTGTTLVIAMIEKTRLHWACAGDSRLYVWRAGKLLQLTRDHNFALLLSKMVVRGSERAQDAMINRRRHALVSYLGMGKLRLIDQSLEAFELEDGDLVLLCSDGCYSAFSAEMALGGFDAHQAADYLVKRATGRKLDQQDNATCVVLRNQRKEKR
jgi:protein phosphatase